MYFAFNCAHESESEFAQKGTSQVAPPTRQKSPSLHRPLSPTTYHISSSRAKTQPTPLRREQAKSRSIAIPATPRHPASSREESLPRGHDHVGVAANTSKRVDGFEKRVDGLNEQLITMQNMVNNILNGQVTLQEKIRVSSNAALQFKDLGHRLELENTNLQNALKIVQGKVRTLLDTHRGEMIDFENKYRRILDSKVSEYRNELEKARSDLRDLSEDRVREKKALEQEYRTKWELKSAKLCKELEEIRKILKLPESQPGGPGGGGRWHPEALKLRDDLDIVQKQVRELAIHQARSATPPDSDSRTVLINRLSEMETKLVEEREKNMTIWDLQLQERGELFEKYQANTESMTKKHQLALDDVRKNTQDLLDTQVKWQERLYGERQEEWEAKLSELQTQLKDSEKTHQDVSETYRAERDSHKDKWQKLHEELKEVRGSKDLEIKELGFRSKEEMHNLEIQHSRDIDALRKSLQSEVERQKKTSEEKLDEARKVQEDYEAKLREMRATLETEIARIQWKNEESRSTDLRKIRAESEANILAAHRECYARIVRLKQAHRKGRRAQRRKLERRYHQKVHKLELEKDTLSRTFETVKEQTLSEIRKIRAESKAKEEETRRKLLDDKLRELAELRSQHEIQVEGLRTVNERELSRNQDEFNARLSSLEKKHEEEKRSLLTIAQEHKTKLQEQHQLIQDLELKHRKVEQALDSEKSRYDDHHREQEQEKQLLQASLEESQRQLNSEKAESAVLRQALDEAKGQESDSVADMVQTLQKKDAEIAQLRGEFAAMKEELGTARVRLSHSAAENQQLEVSLSMQKMETERLKRESNGHLIGKEAEFQDLTRQLKELREQEAIHRKALEQERQLAETQERKFDLRLLDAKKISDREIRDLMDKLRVEENRRRKLFEQVQMLRGTIRVICRIRPDTSEVPIDYETENGEYHDHPATLRVREEVKKVWGEKRSELSDPYEFERIFLPNETNSDVFSEISDFVQSVVDGKKACIFCYGQSGTGKTYTMSNLDEIEARQEGMHYENDGIIPRVKTMIFSEKRRLHEIGMEMSARGCCYEIYDNKLWLLKEGKGKDGPIPKTEGSHFRDLNSPRDFDALIEGGMKKRHFGATEINDRSSRSHFIISLETTVRLKDSTDVVREGLLNLVDLAGAEATRLAGTSGASFEEGKNINSSLTKLGTVFVQLANGDIPTFRGNLLTEFLERSLSGRDCMTLMFVMISPLKKYWTATKHTLALAKDAQAAKRSDKGRGARTAASKMQLGRPRGASFASQRGKK